MPRLIDINGYEIANKTYTYVVQLGGIETIQTYYKSGKSFREIRSVGEKTAQELADLCKFLSGKTSKSNIQYTSDQFNFKDLKTVSLLLNVYHNEKINCSKRTQNVLNSLELEFDLSNKNEASQNLLKFIINEKYLKEKRSNAGEKVFQEMAQIRHKLIHYNPDDILTVRIESGISKVVSLENINNLFKIYVAQRNLCSKRTQNILERLEVEFNSSNQGTEQQQLLQFIIDRKYLEHRINGAGEKVFLELGELQQRLLHHNSVEESFTVAENNKPSLETHLKHLYPETDLSVLLVNDIFSIQRVTCALLIKSNFSTKFGQVIEWLFFRNENLNFKEIAIKSATTPETVRTTYNKFRDKIFPQLIETIKDLGTVTVEGIIPNKSQSYIEVEAIESFVFGSITFEPNERYFESLLSEFYKPEYHFINQIIENELNESKVFDCPTNFHFITNDLFIQSHFLELINFLENEIYLFECAEFEYNLKILIERFYREHNYEYQAQMISDIYELIIKFKLSNIDVKPADVKRLKKQVKKANLKQVLVDLLTEKGEAMKTGDIIHELNENGLDVEVAKLLSQMNHWSQTFSRLGNGMWGLRDWIKGDAPKGSIREIVEGLLLNRDEPIHISEILNYFETFRPISETSLLSNIRVSENIHFSFFHCSFIGLQGKDYPEYWAKISRFSLAKFKPIYLNYDFDYEEKMRQLEKIGYPRVHCEYIIRRGNNNLIE
jgi:hypothetical protein